MKSIYNFVQIYLIWVNGRSIEDVDQHFPIDSNVERNWTDDFKKAVKNFYKAKSINDKDYPDRKEVFQDYVVTLFSFSLNVDEFEKWSGIMFDIKSDEVQDLIPDFTKYEFNVVAEKIMQF